MICIKAAEVFSGIIQQQEKRSFMFEIAHFSKRKQLLLCVHVGDVYRNGQSQKCPAAYGSIQESDTFSL